MKPPKDLRSKYEIKMAERKTKEEQDEEEKRKVEEENRQLVSTVQLTSIVEE